MRIYNVIALALVVLSVAAGVSQGQKGNFYAGQDMHLSAGRMTVYPSFNNDPDKQVVIFEDGFSLSVADSTVSSEKAIAWITAKRLDHRGAETIDYDVQVFLQGKVRAINGKGALTSDIQDAFVDHGGSLVVYYNVTGEVFAKAAHRVTANPEDLEDIGMFKRASRAIRPLPSGLVVNRQAMIPQYKDNLTVIQEKFSEPVANPLRVSDIFELTDDGELASQQQKTAKDSAGQDSTVTAAASEPDDEDRYRYPINISGIQAQKPEVQTSTMPDGSKVATIIGRFYVWQKTDDKGGLREFQADNGVIFYGGGKTEDQTEIGDGDSEIDAVYFQGNIIMTEGDRTIRAEEMFYDFKNHRALAVKAEMRMFDENRGIPVYMRAAKLKQVTENVYKADQIVLTTSEFYLPQLSVHASQLVMTDLRGVEDRTAGDGDFDAVLSDIKVKAGETTVFKWPGMRTNFERPDLPIRGINVGSNSRFGTLVETRWYLSKLLGLKEPDGVDSSLMVDYYSKRGPGAGASIDYVRHDYFGGVEGYIIEDRGDDNLGRTRDNIPVEAETRGRFTARHRHYLPYDWQATMEISYLSDRNFLESFYRSEFNSSKAQETLLHMKRLKDNWGFSFLSKVRLNDFENVTEELPTAEYHLKGQSLFDDRTTFYSDTRISRLRDRFDNNSSTNRPEDFYTFFSTRNELDLPIRQGAFKVVPFVAGTYAVEDQQGYYTDIDSTVNSDPENKVYFGETGYRASTMFWKDDPAFKSEFWDVDGLRHVVTPHTEGVFYHKSDDVIEMRDFMNFGVSQRWLTHRGPASRRRSLDWITLDINATFLTNEEDSSVSPPSNDPILSPFNNSILSPSNAYGPARFLWNDPSIPLLTRRYDTRFGMVRDSINADYTWRISDTTLVLGDMNYDIDAGVVQQANVGISRYIYPDVSVYLASRYLRPVIVSVPSEGVFEQGSNSLIASVTYAINSRYTAIFSEEYNLDYGQNVRTMVGLLRRYHRVYYGLSLSVDESREENSIVFSIWPQGIKDLTFGDRKYASFRDGILED